MTVNDKETGGKTLTAKEQARRRRAAALLGDILPTTARDDTAEGWNEKGSTSHEEQLLRDVPPHHGQV